MSRLVWLILGFIIGTVMVNNGHEMSNPSKAAVGLAFILACAISWWAAYRAKNSAVATAVAVANAKAEINFKAELESKAQALAQNAVNVYFSRDQMQPMMPPIVHEIREELTYIPDKETPIPAIDGDVHTSLLMAKKKMQEMPNT